MLITGLPFAGFLMSLLLTRPSSHRSGAHTWYREGARPSGDCPWASGSLATTHKTAKEEHTWTTTRLTSARTTLGRTRKTFTGTVEIHLRAPWIHSWISSPALNSFWRLWPKKNKKPNTAPELQLNCMGLLGRSGLSKALTLAWKEDPGLCFSYRLGLNFILS